MVLGVLLRSAARAARLNSSPVPDPRHGSGGSARSGSCLAAGRGSVSVPRGSPQLPVSLHPMGSRRRGWVWAQRGRRRTVPRPASLSPQWSVGARRPLAAARLRFAPLGPEWPSRVLGKGQLGRLPRTPRRAALFAVLPPGRVVHRGAPGPCLATARPHNRLVETVEWKE